MLSRSCQWFLFKQLVDENVTDRIVLLSNRPPCMRFWILGHFKRSICHIVWVFPSSVLPVIRVLHRFFWEAFFRTSIVFLCRPLSLTTFRIHTRASCIQFYFDSNLNFSTTYSRWNNLDFLLLFIWLCVFHLTSIFTLMYFKLFPLLNEYRGEILRLLIKLPKRKNFDPNSSNNISGLVATHWLLTIPEISRETQKVLRTVSGRRHFGRRNERGWAVRTTITGGSDAEYV